MNGHFFPLLTPFLPFSLSLSSFFPFPSLSLLFLFLFLFFSLSPPISLFSPSSSADDGTRLYYLSRFLSPLFPLLPLRLSYSSSFPSTFLFRSPVRSPILFLCRFFRRRAVVFLIFHHFVMITSRVVRSKVYGGE